MQKNYDDSNWREESVPYYSGKQLELLLDGPKSLSQSWIMGAMYNEWKRRNGYKDPEPPDVSSSLGEFFKKQEDIFRAHIQIAKTTNLPIIYHSRESYPYILDVLEEEEAYKVGGAAHYFQGDVSTAYRCIELGFFISIAKPVLRIPELQEVVNKIPLENILIETDSFPQPFKKIFYIFDNFFSSSNISTLQTS